MGRVSWIQEIQPGNTPGVCKSKQGSYAQGGYFVPLLQELSSLVTDFLTLCKAVQGAILLSSLSPGLCICPLPSNIL